MTLPASEEERRIISNFVQLVNRRKSCLTCCHFNEVNEECDLAPGQRPPARIVAFGCSSYIEAPPV